MPPMCRNVTDKQLAEATGIVVVPARGLMSVRAGWLTIGAIMILGVRIEVRPRVGVSSDQRRRLVAVAGRALLEGPDESQGWRRRRGVGWGTVVQMRYPSAGESNSSSGAGTVLICSGSSEPSAR